MLVGWDGKSEYTLPNLPVTVGSGGLWAPCSSRSGGGGFGLFLCSSGEQPGVTTPMQRRGVHPDQEFLLNKSFTPHCACLGAFALSALSLLANV